MAGVLLNIAGRAVVHSAVSSAIDHANDRSEREQRGGSQQQAAAPSEEPEMTDEEFEEFAKKSGTCCGTVLAVCVMYAVYSMLAIPAVGGQSVTLVMGSRASADCSGAATSHETTYTATEMCTELSGLPPPDPPFYTTDDGFRCQDHPDGERADEADGECVHLAHCTKSGYNSFDISMKMLEVYATTEDDFNSAMCSLCADDVTAYDEAHGEEYECSSWQRSGRRMCLWIGGISGLCL